MVEKVGVDELSIELPLVLEQCGRRLGIVSWCAVCFQTMLLKLQDDSETDLSR